MIPNYTDEQIIASIKASTKSREEIFSLLFMDKDLRKKSFSIINRLIKSGIIGDDIFADSLIAFVKAIRYNKFKKDSNLTTYLIGICRIHCLRHHQGQKKEKERYEKYEKEMLREVDKEHEIDSLFSITSQKRYEKGLTRKIYKQLSDTCRNYLRQKYGKALSVKEIATENQIKEQSVKNTLSRCYQKLRELIKNDPEVMEQIKLNYGKF